MKKFSEMANRIVDAGSLSNPELIKVDVQVRTGGGILPPRWFMPLVDRRGIGPSKKKTTRSSNRSGGKS